MMKRMTAPMTDSKNRAALRAAEGASAPEPSEGSIALAEWDKRRVAASAPDTSLQKVQRSPPDEARGIVKKVREKSFAQALGVDMPTLSEADAIALVQGLIDARDAAIREVASLGRRLGQEQAAREAAERDLADAREKLERAREALRAIANAADIYSEIDDAGFQRRAKTDLATIARAALEDSSS